jgi:glyoxylase-like metal-dependent hydrolase (beta-lactamase superfamily II)
MTGFLDGRHLGRTHVFSAGLAGNGPLALVDCGPDTCFENLVAALRARGYRPEEVTHLLVTHIHLDHSGGAWRWAQEFGTTVCVHPRGAPHLLAPEKLLASASRIFGAEMARLWGEIQPVPSACLRVVSDGEKVEVGGTVLQAVDTPGHAQHHHAWWVEAERTLFSGDVAGVSIENGPLLPPCPPPDIDLEAWQASLARLRALRPERLILSHFGVLDRPLERFDELERRLLDWAGWVRDRLQAGQGEADIIPGFHRHVEEELRAAGVDGDGLRAYEQADPAAMSVNGLARYWHRRARTAQRP